MSNISRIKSVFKRDAEKIVHYQGSNRELLYLGTFQENIVCQISMLSSTLQPICCLFYVVCSLFCIVCCLFCIVCCLLMSIEQKNSSSKPVVFLPLLSVVCWNTYRAKCSPSFSPTKFPRLSPPCIGDQPKKQT